MSKEIIKAEHVSKIYGLGSKHPYQALNDITLTINEGEFVCIMGPSGAGKSTLLNVLTTIDFPTKGKVFIDGEEVRTLSSHQVGLLRYERLGFIFQNFNLLDALTVKENIAVPLSLASVNRQEIDERIISIASKLNIEKLLEKYPYECSGGQRQRIAIARALINHPKIIVADEPTGNLDSANSHEVLDFFSKLNIEEGVTVLMVTHDPLIASYSSKLLYIKDGMIEHTIHKEALEQKDYFYRIVDINSNEAQSYFMKEAQ
ncbi:ABC transporter ATP-binding protein [Sharpea azabuensis]|uniref:Putative ABC transport system ATP-binding protein n=1 Tax=Sharpea azabuensis TaxID=322505 RepID=A0A1H6RJH4_9FIRM|nr:ABC transporter ATP-binding protein [Sharpea azabuensis]HAV17644.1 ABC transporter ATP-binding protein [Erysipelotrichaceae bacterium]SEI51735.1 putative ABC transport system ATP-binding protein [Sharpea azabuensis]HBG84773.1 ABC transporter ATP-binding protein [Erysipelotrichaceae bacterium]HBZ89068.1 ABC transporter ATP-binding protein [Erysipelotrichaceae bacterium]HCG97029.1 ABC transporter ATP-binding protein [Erysipelotrichaceae bacterium]